MSWSWLAIFGAGLGTFVSPCVFPLVPILVATWATSDSERGSKWARVRQTAWFAVGFTLAFVSLGVGFAAFSTTLGSLKPVLFVLASLILAVFGLRMIGVIQGKGLFSWIERSFRIPDISDKLPKGLNGVVFGLIFGLGWTPCVGPILGAVLTYVASRQASPERGAALLFVFSFGISLPLLVAAYGLEAVQPVMKRMRGWVPKLEYAMGIGLLIFAGYLVSQARFSASPSRSHGLTPIVSAVDDLGRRVALGRKTPGKARMVFFYSENCPICKAMERFLPDFEKSCSSESFRLSRVDVDLAENSSAALAYEIHAVPTISILNEDGRELVHLVGYQTESRLRDAARSTTGILCADAKHDSEPIFRPDQTCSTGSHC